MKRFPDYALDLATELLTLSGPYYKELAHVVMSLVGYQLKLEEKIERYKKLEKNKKKLKPLTDEEILQIHDYILDHNGYPTDVINLARAIEERHGIK